MTLDQRKFPVADGHCDFLYYMREDGYDVAAPTGTQCIAIPYLLEGGVALQFFAAWTDMEKRTPALQQSIQLIDAYYRMLDAHGDVFTPFTPDYTPESGKVATLLTIEGGEAIEGQLENLRVLRRLGVRAMTLTWNATNELAGPAMRKGNKGLTPLGKEVLAEMNRIGMALDVSHLSDAGIDDALALSKRPIFASHSNARFVSEHKRSLCDEHIKAISQMGGVIGVNFYPLQLTGTKAACIDDIVRHIEHIAEVGGPEHVAVGSDFDGMNTLPADMKNSADFPKLFNRLAQMGYSDEAIYGISYKNLRDYIVQFC